MPATNHKLGLLIISICLCLTVKSQVSIGSLETPTAGALLQLKNIDGKTDGSANASKGLGLPRVKLTSVNDLFPMFEDANGNVNADYNTAAKKEDLDKKHTGLLVYNVNECFPIFSGGTGINVWNGEKWENLRTWEGSTVTGKSGRIYKTAQFGPAGEWMIENLAETEYDEGEIGTLNCNNSIGSYSEKAYYFPSNQNTIGNQSIDSVLYNSFKEIGLLYTWSGATNNQYSDSYVASGKPNQPTSFVQGICPKGWYIPSDYDFGILEKEMSEHPYLYSSVTTPTGFDEDKYWKHASVSSWYGEYAMAMKSQCAVPYGTATLGKSSENGFNILLVGLIENGNYVGYGTSSFIWTSTIQNGNTAWYRGYQQNKNSSGRGSSYSKANLHSVRCKKK